MLDEGLGWTLNWTQTGKLTTHHVIEVESNLPNLWKDSRVAICEN